MIYRTANNFLFINSIHWIIIRESDGPSISIILDRKKKINFPLISHSLQSISKVRPDCFAAKNKPNFSIKKRFNLMGFTVISKLIGLIL